MSDTPETDKEMRDVWLKSDDSCVETWAEKNGDTIDVVDADFARRLERQRDEARKELKQIDSLFFGGFLEDTPKDGLAWRLFDEVMAMKKERDAYAETLRQIASSAVCGGIVRERHPELAP